VAYENVGPETKKERCVRAEAVKGRVEDLGPGDSAEGSGRADTLAPYHGSGTKVLPKKCKVGKETTQDKREV